jgi:hypothetical protein
MIHDAYQEDVEGIGTCLRVVVLEDGIAVHNAFLARR